MHGLQSGLNFKVSVQCLLHTVPSVVWLSKGLGTSCHPLDMALLRWPARCTLLVLKIERTWRNWSWVLVSQGMLLGPPVLGGRKARGSEWTWCLKPFSCHRWAGGKPILPGNSHRMCELCSWRSVAIASQSNRACPLHGPGNLTFQDSVPWPKPNFWFLDLIIWHLEVKKSSNLSLQHYKIDMEHREEKGEKVEQEGGKSQASANSGPRNVGRRGYSIEVRQAPFT